MTTNTYTMIYSIFLPLFCVLSSTSSVLGRRHHVSRTTFVPRKTATKETSLSAASTLPPLSSLDTSAFSSERDAQQILASLLVATTSLCRGGQQQQGYDDYYDDRGGYNQNNDDDYYSSSASSKQYGGGDDNNYDDRYDDRGSSYDDRGSGDSKENSGSGRPRRNKFAMPDIIRTGNRKIGLPLLAIGGALTIVGASLFFNKTLMRLGNLFFVAGVPMTLGPGRTAGYFFQPKKARATACLCLGLVLVFVGWPILGIILEAFGMLNLFGNMFPVAIMVMKQMPVIGPLLKGNFGGSKNNKKDSNKSGSGSDPYDDYDDRYSDDRYQDRDRYNDDGPNYNDGGYQDNNNNNSYY